MTDNNGSNGFERTGEHLCFAPASLKLNNELARMILVSQSPLTIDTVVKFVEEQFPKAKSIVGSPEGLPNEGRSTAYPIVTDGERLYVGKPY